MAPQKIVIDTDPGVDDVLAILMGLASPEVDVALISIVFGNTHAPVAHSNLLKIYHSLALELVAIPEAAKRYKRLSQQDKTVLTLGEDGPIGGKKAVAAYFHGLDGLSNITETHPHFTPPRLDQDELHKHLEISSKESHVAILDLLRSEPEHTVSIVALGPLTNLAHAFRADPETFQRVQSVVWMGGTLEHPGNTSPTAEFNCFADPYAAQQIVDGCRAGKFQLIMAPLDITTPHQIPFSDLIHPDYVPLADGTLPVPSTDSAPSPLRSFISAMLVRVRGLQASFGLPDAMEMHDPVAVWYAISQAAAIASTPSGSTPTLAAGWELKPRDFKIERVGEYTRGMCVVDRRGTGDEGETRTTSERLQKGAGAAVPSLLPAKDETKGRMGEDIETAKNLPLVIVGTPGKDVLRQTLLQRVFSEQL